MHRIKKILLLLIGVIALHSGILFSQPQTPIFEKLSVKDGLPENSVQSILQDKYGYMWFGTQNGLVRYDGYNMRVYHPQPDDSLSISNRNINIIYEDRSGKLWIGTDRGLNRFDRTTETFTQYLHNPDDSTSINSNLVRNIYEFESGKLFVGTDAGLNLLDVRKKCFEQIIAENQPTSFDVPKTAFIYDRVNENHFIGRVNKILVFNEEKKSLEEYNEFLDLKNELGSISSFCQGVDGTLWIAHTKGLAKLNTRTKTIKHYLQKKSNTEIPDNHVTHLTEDHRGLIWGIAGGGLFSFNPENEMFKRFKHDPKNPDSITDALLLSIYTDRSGIMWVGSWSHGLNKWDANKHKFNIYRRDTNLSGSVFRNVRHVVEDSDEDIWFGTQDGLYRYSRLSNEFKLYQYNPDGKRNDPRWAVSGGANIVSAIHIDDSGFVWFGTEARGIGRFDPSRKTYSFYSYDPGNPHTISNNSARHFLHDDRGFLWIGTWGGGLCKFDMKTGEFKRYVPDPENPNSLSNGIVTCLARDRAGTLWIGTDSGGLNRFYEPDESFTSYSFGPEYSISTIHEDQSGQLWVGLNGRGLYIFDREKEKWILRVSEKNGLANNNAGSILEDNSGNLWVGTGNGLSRVDSEINSVKSFFLSDLADENRYRRGSASKTSAGEMLFGTFKGFIMFHPDSIKDDPVPPKVLISNVSLFNRPGEEITCDEFIPEAEGLQLTYTENDLRFDYVGLHFSEPEKNQYKYMLENFDDDWINAGTQRNATYTNLDAGEYIFRVTAANRDGIWNVEGASLKIVIPPPFWATWWAYSFYILFVLGLLYSIRRYELNRQSWKHGLELETVEAVKYKELNKLKSRFFANISHEFRTPLTLILGPAKNILGEPVTGKVKKNVHVIERNARRLMQLINQLLDLSRLETGNLSLTVSKGDIRTYLRGMIMSFESIADTKNISLKEDIRNTPDEAYFDKDKLNKILSNLLSNAFKFTPEGGEIIVLGNEEQSGRIKIEVSDTGTGIEKDELPKLFDRFYQVDSSHTREHQGTGIGLSLTKELVELHHGSISVESRIGVGTKFTVEIPVAKEAFSPEELTEDIEDTDDFGTPYDTDLSESIDDSETESEDSLNNGKTMILVVEDNSEVRDYIKESLVSEFNVEMAFNGEHGVSRATELIPDLIISDVMMPKMDGNELTRILKQDEKTSHIPIILLTAKSEHESRLEGLETGADDYLTKPFDTKELQIRISNLINIRKKLQRKFADGEVKSSPKDDKKLSKLDEQFIARVGEVINNHLSEEDFSIEQFAEEVGMSRVQVHRKLKALTGKSASLFIRSIRLEKARQLIREGEGNISEIAYSVGFSSAAYFTNCFKDEFGFAPSELKK